MKNKEHKNLIGSSHLRVGIELKERSVRIISLWLVEQPLVQTAILNQDIIARINVINHETLIQTFSDPRISRGIYQKKTGHSINVYDSGILYISVPFTKIEDLRSLNIKITDVTGLEIKDRSIKVINTLFEKPPKKIRTIFEINSTDVQLHADWVKITKHFGLNTENGKFEIYIDKAKKFRWRLVKNTGEIVADSGQGYETLAQCEADLRWIRKNSSSVQIIFLP